MGVTLLPRSFRGRKAAMLADRSPLLRPSSAEASLMIPAKKKHMGRAMWGMCGGDQGVEEERDQDVELPTMTLPPGKIPAVSSGDGEAGPRSSAWVVLGRRGNNNNGGAGRNTHYGRESNLEGEAASERKVDLDGFRSEGAYDCVSAVQNLAGKAEWQSEGGYASGCGKSGAVHKIFPAESLPPLIQLDDLLPEPLLPGAAALGLATTTSGSERENGRVVVEPASYTSWDSLPRECKQLVLLHLPPRDLSRTAAVSKELSELAAGVRSRMTHISLKYPPTNDIWTYPQMVAAYPNLLALTIRRQGASGQASFFPLFKAAAGLSPPGGLHIVRQPSGFMSLSAKKGPVQLRSLRHVSVHGCNSLCDTDVQTLLALHPQLEILSLEKCPKIGDETLAALGSFKHRNASSMLVERVGANGPSAAVTTSPGFFSANGTARALRPPLLPKQVAAPSSSFSARAPSHPHDFPKRGKKKAGPASARTLGWSGPGSSCSAGSGQAWDGPGDSAAAHSGGDASERAEAEFGSAGKAPAKVAETAGGIVEVAATGCAKLTDHGVQSLLHGNGSRDSLMFLNVSNCPMVTHRGLAIPSFSALRVLVAGKMASLQQLSLVLSDGQPLQQLSLPHCPQLKEVRVSAPGLCSLLLPGCGALQRVTLDHAPKLETLSVSHCASLSSLDVTGTLARMRTLDMAACTTVDTRLVSALAVVMPDLEELNLEGCTQIIHLSLPYLSLERLDVSSCTKLQSLVVESKHLVALGAYSCRDLLEVRLESASLRQLLLANCRHLQSILLPIEQVRNTAREAGHKVWVPPLPSKKNLSRYTISAEWGRTWEALPDSSAKDNEGYDCWVHVSIIGCASLPEAVKQELMHL